MKWWDDDGSDERLNIDRMAVSRGPKAGLAPNCRDLPIHWRWGDDVYFGRARRRAQELYEPVPRKGKMAR